MFASIWIAKSLISLRANKHRNEKWNFMSAPIPTEAETLIAKRAFTVCVVPSSIWLPTRNNQSVSLPAHEFVLRPLLRCAIEAWAYEMNEVTDVFEAARDILDKRAGKYRIDLSGEPIRGHELFWNAAGGKRGSIALLFRKDEVPGAEVFPYCERAFVVSNPSTPHTPAAYRYSKSATESGECVVAMFSRSNGLQWLSFHGSFEHIAPLFSQAGALCGTRMPPTP
jgi:hypothetical protein